MMGARLLFARLAMVASAIGLTSGCNLIIEPDRKQCAVDEDCTNRGPAFANTVCGAEGTCMPDPTWSCLDGPPPEPIEPTVFYVTIHAQSIADTTQPVVGAAAKLCRRINPECLEPEATGVTDGNGDVVFEIPSNLTGPFVVLDKFDETLPEDQWDNEWVPAYYYFNPNVTSDMTVAVQMATFRLRNFLTLLLETPQQNDRGLILMNVVSCLGAGAPGVGFRVDRSDELTIPFYVVGGVPNASLTATNVDGFGGFINIPPGLVAVSGEIQETQRVIDTIAFPVFANAISYSRLVARGQ